MQQRREECRKRYLEEFGGGLRVRRGLGSGAGDKRASDVPMGEGGEEERGEESGENRVHPELYSALIFLRRKVARSLGIQPFEVMETETVRQLALRRPCTVGELAKVPTIGACTSVQ